MIFLLFKADLALPSYLLHCWLLLLHLYQAALHLRLRSLSGEVPEAIERPLPWDRYKIGQRFSQNKPPMEPPQE